LERKVSEGTLHQRAQGTLQKPSFEGIRSQVAAHRAAGTLAEHDDTHLLGDHHGHEFAHIDREHEADLDWEDHADDEPYVEPHEHGHELAHLFGDNNPDLSER